MTKKSDTEFSHINVIKASGEKVPFDPSKLRLSLKRSGASDEVIEDIILQVQSSLYEGISTRKIYRKAYSILRKTSGSFAARYKLKKAIYELGPTGFPFEKFVSAILDYEGYNTQVNRILTGHCVNHEIDIIASKAGKQLMIECKFHNDQGNICDVKIPLYIHSRFEDVDIQWRKKQRGGKKIHEAWIFTNTRFTYDAIKYGKCAGLKLFGWDYPKKDSLKKRIDSSGLHPLTCLTSLTALEKQKLLEKEIVLSADLIKHPEFLQDINIPSQRHKNIINEARQLCKRF
jgi:hypothetical protein